MQLDSFAMLHQYFFGGGLEIKTMKPLPPPISYITFLITKKKNLTSVQVILVPYCYLFCVLSNDMLNAI